MARDYTVTTKASVDEQGGDTQFVDVTGVERNTSVISNLVQMKGLSSPESITVSVVEGSGTVNAYVCSTSSSVIGQRTCSESSTANITPSTSGATIANGRYVQLALTSSTSFDTPTTVKLTVGGVERLWTVKTRQTTTVPADLGYFLDAENAERNTTVTSNAIKVSGFKDVSPVTVEVVSGGIGSSDTLFICASETYATQQNCFYSNGSTKYYRTSTATGTTVNPDEYIQVRLTSPAEFDAEKTVKITVGGIERFCKVKTRPSVTTPPTVAEFRPSAGVERNSLVSSNPVKIDGITDPTLVTFELTKGTANSGDMLYVCNGESYAAQMYCYYGSGSKKYYRTNTNTSVMVNPGEYIQLRLRSEADYDSEKAVKITVGGVERTWSVKTRPLSIDPVDFGVFKSTIATGPNQTVNSDAIPVKDILDPSPVSVTVTGSAANTTKVVTCNKTYAASGRCATNAIATTTAAGNPITVSDGHYIALQTRSAAQGVDVNVTVTVGGVSRNWVVTTPGP